MADTFPFTVRDGDGRDWTIDNWGRISSGGGEFTADAANFGITFSSVPAVSLGGRQVTFAPSAFGDVKQSRKVYVSDRDGFVRIADIYENTGSIDATRSVSISSSMSDFVPQAIRTSKPDGVFDAQDQWLVREPGTAGQKVASFVVAGRNGDGPSFASASFGSVSYTYNLQLEPGETKVVLHYLALDRTVSRAADTARALADLKGDALRGLSKSELAAVVNFEPGKRAYRGTDGNDRLIGDVFDERFRALDGNDRVEGRGGDDLIYGGLGRDALFGGAGDDLIFGDGSNKVTTTETVRIPSTRERMSISLTLPDQDDGRTINAEGFVSRTPITSDRFNIAFVIDVSGSVNAPFNGRVRVPDKNGDGVANTVIDAEIAGYEALLRGMSRQVGAENINVGLVTFESTARTNAVVNAATDSDGDGVPDIVEALRSLTHLGSTNFEAGLVEARKFFDGAGEGQDLLFFLSDGARNAGGDYLDDVAALRAAGVTIRSYGVGANASEPQLDLVDDRRDNDSAKIVLDPSELSRVLIDPGISRSDVDRIDFFVNGKRSLTIDGDELVRTPLGLSYAFAAKLTGLRPNKSDEIRAKLVASDRDGTSVSTWQKVEVLRDKPGGDRIYGGDGNDILRGEGGADRLWGGDGRDALYGGAMADRLWGDKGRDLLDGGRGADRMAGGTGDDIYFVDSAGDRVIERADGGTDTVAAKVDWRLPAHVEILRLLDGATRGVGNDLGNRIFGSDDGDRLSGGKGRDTLRGGAGDDRLSGGEGSDVLTGGAGRDSFVFDAAPGRGNIDRITDFNARADRILLDSDVFRALESGALSADAFHRGRGAADRDDRIIYQVSEGRLLYDPDGSGPRDAVRFAEVDPGTPMSASDFFVI